MLGLLVRAITRRVPTVDYRAIGAAAYLGLGSVWALGLSSSAALLQATNSAIPAALLPVTGVIPLRDTVFLWQSLVTAALLIAVSVAVAWFSYPAPGRERTAEQMGVRFEAEEAGAETPRTPGERLEASPLLPVAVALLMLASLVMQVREKGVDAAADLNTFNFAFVAAGLLLHGRPRSFLRAVSRSVPATAGVQNWHRRLHQAKKIVPEPRRPRRQSSSPGWEKALATRGWRPVRHTRRWSRIRSTPQARGQARQWRSSSRACSARSASRPSRSRAR